MALDMDPLGRSGKGALRRTAEFLWPSRSLISGKRTGASGPIAPAEWAELTFLTGNLCNACGNPFEVDLGEAAMCAACHARPPKWTRARAALAYNDACRRPILDLKYAARRDGVQTMGNWMAAAGRPLLDGADLLVPVPLHYSRLVRRGYNQSGWLAQAIAKRSDVPVSVDALKRTKRTPSQGGLSGRQRRANVAGAFRVRRRCVKHIKDKRVVLVDDVLTTGATVTACCRALLKAGASHVDVLVLARVVRPTDITI